MTEERKGQIALLIVKHILHENSARLRPGFKRKIAHSAKQVGILAEEADEFAVDLYRETTDEFIASKASRREQVLSILTTIRKCRKPW